MLPRCFPARVDCLCCWKCLENPPDSYLVDSIPVCLGISRSIFADNDYFSKKSRDLLLNTSQTTITISVSLAGVCCVKKTKSTDEAVMNVIRKVLKRWRVNKVISIHSLCFYWSNTNSGDVELYRVMSVWPDSAPHNSAGLLLFGPACHFKHVML